MKKHLVLSFFLILLGFSSRMLAQSMDVNWSEKQVYENKKDGFFDEFIGGNSKYVYAKFNRAAWKPNKANKKIKIVAFDKNTMDKVASKAIIGFKENKTQKDKYADLTFFDALVFENSVNLFWQKKSKGKYELYAESFDTKLNEKIKLKKIYEVSASGKKWDPNFFVIGSKDAGDKMIIGAELPREKDQNVKFEYKVLKADFSFDAANQLTLPYSVSKKNTGLTSSYEIGKDGFLYVRTHITMDKDERKSLKKGEAPTYNLLSVINPASGKMTVYPLKFENKNLFYVDYLVTTGKVKIFAMFCDLNKDPKGRDSHGIFYGEIDNSTNTMTSTNFAMFDKATLDKLFANDKEDKHKSGIFSSKKAKESDSESLDDNYVIEKVMSLDNNNIVLFFSKMTNYSRQVCDSKGNCTTYYYCQKDNVTAFKLDNTGKILWSNNLDRRITYSGWYRYDVRVVSKDDKLYVVYGSTFQATAKKKNGRSKKSKKQLQDRFEYAVFNYKDGTFKRDEYQLNAINAKKKDKKSINPLQITTIDNHMFVQSTRIGFKVLPIVLGCVGALVCPPVIAIPFLSGDARKGSGYLGTITPLK